MRKKSMHNPAFVTVALSLLALLAVPSAARAVAGEGIEAGAFLVSPGLSIDMTYDSNIYRTPENEEQDLITSIRPSLKIILPRERLRFQLEGNANLVMYQDNEEENTQSYSVSGSAGAEFPGGMGFTLAETYTHDFTGHDYFADKEYFGINRIYARVSYLFSEDLKVEADYFNYQFDYQRANELDRMENTFGVICFYKFLPKTSLLLEFDYSDIGYREEDYEEKDNRVMQVRGGLTWEMTGKSTGEVRLGYQEKSYRNSDMGDRSNLVASVSTETVFTRSTSLALELQRGTFETNYQDNPYYLSTRLSAALKHKFTHKISGTAGFFATRESYPEKTTEDGKTARREDDIVGVRLGASFQMYRWLALDAGYVLEMRDSNLPPFEFDDHRASFSVKTVF